MEAKSCSYPLVQAAVVVGVQKAPLQQDLEAHVLHARFHATLPRRGPWVILELNSVLF